MRIAFTGTRNGMSNIQKEKVERLIIKYLEKYDTLTIYHGDCIGADKDFHDICNKYRDKINIIIYPGHDKKSLLHSHNTMRAYCEGDTINISKEYLSRNRNIINQLQDTEDILIACPISDIEEIRSGTWYTIRYTRKQNKNIKIIV